MEVMIAALILALTVVGSVASIGTARANLLREERRWSREHLMNNVMEFCLMAGAGNPLPAGLLPDGFSATCELYNVEEGIPEEAQESIRGWRLGEFRVRIYDRQGNLMAEQAVRKIIKETDVDYTSLGAR